MDKRPMGRGEGDQGPARRGARGRAMRRQEVLTAAELNLGTVRGLSSTTGTNLEGTDVESNVSSSTLCSSRSAGLSSQAGGDASSSASTIYDLATVTIGPRSTVDDEVRSVAAAASSTGVSSRFSRSTAVVTKREGFNKHGRFGAPVPMISNYFKMNGSTNFTLNQYRVDFVPAEDNTKAKKALMRVHKDALGAMIFDGHMMYRTDVLDENLENLTTLADNNITYHIHIRLVGHVSPDDPMFLQFYNIVMRNCLQLLDMEKLGRNFYDRHAKISLSSDKLELWPGYITAIRNHEYGTNMCVDVTHKVLRTDSVLDYIKEMLESFKHNQDKAKEIIQKELIGQIVMTHYNQKTYRVDKVDFDSTPEGTLDDGNPETTITYVEFFKKKYGISIKNSDIHQPMLVSFPKKKDVNKGHVGDIYLVPSLCNLTGLTDEMRKNFQLMRRLSTHLHMNPTARKEKLDGFMGRLANTNAVRDEFKRWDIKFDSNYINVTGRNLGVEAIHLANNVTVQPDLMGDWTQGFRRAPLYVSKPLMNWILYAPDTERNNIPDFLKGIKKQAEALGIKVEQPLETRYYDGRRDLNERDLEAPIKGQRGAVNFVFFILRNNQLKRYATVKKLFVLHHSLPMQCFLAKNLHANSFNSICTKVMIQVNSKLGGEPWHLQNPIKEVMVLGFDVYHCAERKNVSVGALVSTINNNLTRYFSTVSFHQDKKELSSNMCLDTKRSLDSYYTSNSKLPLKIVLYRDGVGEGQIPFVLEHEVSHMELAIEEKYAEVGQPKPAFAFVIVTKKINSRLLVKRATEYINPPPGTVVDDVITLPERYDFFLVSQSVRQGTASPTSFNVVKDTSGLTADRMQRFTYKMCHMYFNWSGTVAVPAPCQYAHKLAYLTGVVLNDKAPARLADLLWYL